MAVPTYALVAQVVTAPNTDTLLWTTRLGGPQSDKAYVVVPQRLSNRLTLDIAGYPNVDVRATDLQFYQLTQGIAYFEKGWLFVPPEEFGNSFYALWVKTPTWLDPVQWDVFVLSVS